VQHVVANAEELRKTGPRLPIVTLPPLIVRAEKFLSARGRDSVLPRADSSFVEFQKNPFPAHFDSRQPRHSTRKRSRPYRKIHAVERMLPLKVGG
jgi:hypothetical protein